MNSYNLTFAVLLITAAALGDRYGRRKLYAAGLAVFTASSAACAVAPDLGWLIAGPAGPGPAPTGTTRNGVAPHRANTSDRRRRCPCHAR